METGTIRLPRILTGIALWMVCLVFLFHGTRCSAATNLTYPQFQQMNRTAVSKTAKKQVFTWKNKTLKKAEKVKTGNTRLTVKKGEGYVRFQAPKTGKYTISFTGAEAPEAGKGFIMIQKKDTKVPSCAFLTTCKSDKKTVKAIRFPVREKVDLNQLTRVQRATWLMAPVKMVSGTLKVKKGETIYLYFYSGAGTLGGTLSIS